MSFSHSHLSLFFFLFISISPTFFSSFLYCLFFFLLLSFLNLSFFLSFCFSHASQHGDFRWSELPTQSVFLSSDTCDLQRQSPCVKERKEEKNHNSVRHRSETVMSQTEGVFSSLSLSWRAVSSVTENRSWSSECANYESEMAVGGLHKCCGPFHYRGKTHSVRSGRKWQCVWGGDKVSVIVV